MSKEEVAEAQRVIEMNVYRAKMLRAGYLFCGKTPGTEWTNLTLWQCMPSGLKARGVHDACGSPAETGVKQKELVRG
jgi:hypothetical protein